MVRTRFLAFVLLTSFVAVLSACGDGGGAEANCEGNCLTPPAPVCNGDQLITFSPLGECVGGLCDYSPAQSVCELGCREGACRTEADLCAELGCTTETVLSCDGDTSVAATGTGGCDANAGACSFDEEREDCAANGRVCSEGLCVDPCAGVSCNEPPEAACEGDEALTYAEIGVCAGGACDYAETRVDCAEDDQVCFEGECVDPDLCEDVTCGAPPEPACDSIFAVTYSGDGVCNPASGVCEFTEDRENCAAAGGFCEAGACVLPPDPCEDVVCDNPPSDFCEAGEVVSYADGVCVEGTCEYAEERVDCADTSQFCFDAACVDIDPCEGVVCDLPPATFCEEGVAVALGDGVCADGVCIYAEERTDCDDGGAFCLLGECVLDDPCDGLACDNPPDARCDGNAAVDYEPAGVCVDGDCIYSEIRLDCTTSGEFCEAGACVASDPCDGVTCDDPPAPFCDGPTAVAFEPTGVCAAGECAYGEVRESCPSTGAFCEAGACVRPDVCEGVVCDDPPSAFCDGDTAVGFSIAGACEDRDGTAACAYEEVREACGDVPDGFCFDGACATLDLCTGISCDTPPAPSCDGATAVTGVVPGTCAEGECAYDTTRRDCDAEGLACLEGLCVSAAGCEDVVCDAPPRAVCDGDTAVVYPTELATCAAGECAYPSERVDCASEPGGFCFDGACETADPCLGISCDSPPPRVCEGALAIRYANPGICADGACDYARIEEDCGAAGEFCVEGTCQATDPCDGVACIDPPPTRCDGDLLLEYAGGACIGGECDYPPAVTDCNDLTGFCFDGACEGTDLCDAVVCDTPPIAFCDGDTAVGYGAGECRVGVCLYDEVRTDCAATGEFCASGSCVPADPCDSIACDAPPEGFCDGDTAITYAGGACTDGLCAYDPIVTDCTEAGEFCFEGACQAVDPCLGVVCDAPPAPSCDGNQAVVPVEIGACADGVCSYDTAREDCSATGQFCFEGACQLIDPCSDVTCDSPPVDVCDGDTALAYGAGTCAAGTCTYEPAPTDCAALTGFCEGGVCVGTELCDGITCDARPMDFCDGTTAVAYRDGTCRVGACDYGETREDCADDGRFCRDGACVLSDPCDGVVCDSPPPATCSGDLVVEYVTPGTCGAGDCTYETVTTDCSETGQFCEAGACVDIDPCLGVLCNSPPGPSCDGTEIVDYLPTGACGAGGVCTYTPVRIDCAATGQFCEGAFCVDVDPCLGVSCDAPPADFCDGNTAFRFDDPGLCTEGTCSYEPTPEVCDTVPGGFCQFGRCLVADLCADVTCDSPPVPACSDDDASVVAFSLPGECADGVCNYVETVETCDAPPSPVCDADTSVTYAASGTCVGGECSYEETRTNCADTGQFCSDGTCRDIDPCLGVTCNSPPGAECEGNTVVDFGPTGVCSAGICSYTPIRTNCLSSGLFCVAGECVPDDPCGGLTCDTPPSNVCDGDVAVTYATPGACDSGSCSYEETRDNCASVPGGFCFDGACESIDPCEGVFCDDPPAATCAGPTRIVYSTPGTCSGGVCDYDFFPEPCNDPPVAFCEGDTAVDWASGTCSAGACAYAQTRTDCTARGEECVSGACVPNPCIGVTCEDPPAGTCEGSVATGYANPGACSGGTCTYDTFVQDCAPLGMICVAGECVFDDPCDGVVCDTAPAPFCDGEVANTYATPGVCVDGSCEYAVSTEDCAAAGGTCLGGVCQGLDPCEGVVCDTPPATICADAENRLEYAPVGICEVGACVYETSVSPCLTGQSCEGGVCVDDPCTGVACDSPPAPFCFGNEVRSPLTPGTCNDGACLYDDYDAVDCTDTEQLCVDGACVDPTDDCTTLGCAFPPAGSCDENVGTRFEAPGTCNSTTGVCEFVEVVDDCDIGGRFCFDGVCQEADPCDGLVCDEPRGAFCEGNERVVQGTPGACEAGRCTYPETRTDCGSSFCVLGECVSDDPCAGVTCDDPPRPFCTGDTLTTFPASGTCDLGACSYAPSVTDCGATGDVCVAGACVEDTGPCTGIECVRAAFCDGNVAVSDTAAGVCIEATVSCDFSGVEVRTNCSSTGDVCVAGACVPPSDLVEAGDLEITEFLATPAGDDSTDEWIEVRNVSGRTISFATLDLFVASSGAEIDLSGLGSLEPGAYVVLGSTTTAGGGADFVWGGPAAASLGNIADAIAIVSDSTTIAGVAYNTAEGWPGAPGEAAQYDESLSDPNDAANWCSASGLYDGVNRGSPGAANPACP